MRQTRAQRISSVILAAILWYLPFYSACTFGQATENRQQSTSAAIPSNAELVEFPGPAGKNLHGFLYKPAGNGPFPAVIWNHGSERLPGWQPDLAQFYISKGFVFFIPHRSGHGKSSDAGPYIKDEMNECSQHSNKDECVIKLHEKANLDVVAAYDWLKQRPFVESDNIVMSGLSFGGIQTLLTAEKGLGIRCFISFAPAAMSWAGVPGLHNRLLNAAKQAKPPIFLIQAMGDYNMGPSEVIGAYLKTKGGLNNAKVYPKFGPANQDNHAGFAIKPQGIAIWGNDVMSFINASFQSQ
ncbi:MAG TPA: dienelactone hydrolase family protein [Blastocatellia bacterium]|nr:dienelactone hydrolase family protein [Blastocatellia bacterium]